MRVIAGTARGKNLQALPGEDITRPTINRVKEAMFSSVQFCAGSTRAGSVCRQRSAGHRGSVTRSEKLPLLSTTLPEASAIVRAGGKTAGS